MMKALDIIIPVYNEKLSEVNDILLKLKATIHLSEKVNIILVDDCSDVKLSLDSLVYNDNIVLLHHKTNKGYGEALKSGIRYGSAPWIAIIDADGTYPADKLRDLVERMDNADMVVGIRTGAVCQIPWPRRFPKLMLNRLASYMAGIKIEDLNSGMRVFTRELSYQLWPFFPRRFSFTSTLTMGAILGGYRVEETSIDYYKRKGNSSIQPLKDTLRFIHIIIRMGTNFHPLKLFLPIAISLFSIGFIKGFFRDFFAVGYIGNLSITFMLAALQILLMGYLGELIVTSRLWRKVDTIKND